MPRLGLRSKVPGGYSLRETERWSHEWLVIQPRLVGWEKTGLKGKFYDREEKALTAGQIISLQSLSFVEGPRGYF